MITVVLLNWKRRNNIIKIIDSLLSQSLKPIIYLWNNSPEVFVDTRLDLVVNSSVNLRCWVRWTMGTLTSTKYICSLDDDLMFSDNYVLEDMVRLMEQEKNPLRVYGLNGVILPKDGSYRKHGGGRKFHEVDIIKGRLMCLRTENIYSVINRPSETEDDIAICGILSGGVRLFHRQIGWLWDRVIDLPDNDGLCGQKGHWERRDLAAIKYFGKN